MNKNLISSAMIALSTAQEVAPIYDASYKCGKCIKSGFNFCHTGTHGQAMASGDIPLTSTCCENGECPEASDAAYHCSNTFTDVDYALSMCPQE